MLLMPFKLTSYNDEGTYNIYIISVGHRLRSLSLIFFIMHNIVAIIRAAFFTNLGEVKSSQILTPIHMQIQI